MALARPVVGFGPVGRPLDPPVCNCVSLRIVRVSLNDQQMCRQRSSSPYPVQFELQFPRVVLFNGLDPRPAPHVSHQRPHGRSVLAGGLPGRTHAGLPSAIPDPTAAPGSGQV